MAKKKSEEKPIKPQIEIVPITQEMQKAYMDYAMSVIVSRALPDVRDGLKPVQRRIIYAMHDQGMGPGSRYQKCAAVVGEVLKKYHPHGDLSVYDALVRMAQDFSLRYPLIDGQGNFGSVDGDRPAAMRYTECRLAPISGELLLGIANQTVEFMPNYSGYIQEPKLLPALLPNLLLNGATGIAVGMATNIPPHNLGEIVDASIFMIDRGKPVEPPPEEPFKPLIQDLIAKITPQTSFESEATIEDLLKFIQGPDFPTGGEIYDKNEVLQAYTTGKGRIVMRGVAKIVETKGGKYQILISEIPFQVNKSNMVSKIAELVKRDKIKGISDIRDESDRTGMQVVIVLKSNIRPQRVLNQLFKHTELQKAFNANMVALINGEPKILTLKKILTEFIKHRQVIIINRTLFILKKSKDREHILEGLIIALRHLDAVIETIKKSRDAEVAKVNLIKKFKLTEIQAQAILDMQLRRLAALERKKIRDELEEIKKKIAEYEALLANPIKILNRIKKELSLLKKKYGDERKTKVYKRGLEDFKEEDLIAAEDVIVTLTEGGYIKRLGIDTYRRQSRGGKGVIGIKTKEEDVVSHVITANTHDKVLFFTNKGKVYSLKVHEIPEAQRTAKGTALVNLIDIEQGERPQSIVRLHKDLKALNLFFVTKLGTVKKTELSEFGNIRRSGIISIRLKRGDELSWVKTTTGRDEIILVTARGKSIRFKEKAVRAMGRSASGVRGIRLKKEGDYVVGMALVDPKAELLVVTENGYGKRTKISEYTVQHRGGSGILTANVTKKIGKVVASRIVNGDTADILLTSTGGQVIRLPIKDISTLGRATQGVRLMNLKEDDKVAAMACLEEEKNPKASKKGKQRKRE